MSWLADRLGVHLNLRPLAKVAGGVVGNAILPGIGGAALGAGLGDFFDSAGHGEGLGTAAKKGALTGGLTYGGGKALGALKNAFAPGSEIGSGLGAAGSGGGVSAGGGAAGGPAIPYGALGAADTAPGGGGVMGALHAAGSFASAHPNAVGMGLQGLGGIASSGSENALRNAQAAQLAAQTRAMDDEEEAKKARAQAMQPLLAALMGGHSVPSNPYGAGANPYGAGR